MSFHFSDIARAAATDHAVSEAEILELRRAGWADGRMTREEAESIFAAQSAIAVPSREWSDFFVEQVVTEIIGRLARDGQANNGHFAVVDQGAAVFARAEALRLKDAVQG